MILAEGPSRPKLAVVGDAPTEKELLSGRCFAGGSGQLLDLVLNRIGVPRSELYLTYLYKTRVPHNEFDNLYVDGPKRKVPKPELVRAKEDLVKELSSVRPNITLCLGPESFKALTNSNKSLDSWRGSLLWTAVGKTIGTYNPATVLKVYENFPIFELDIKRAIEESSSPDLKKIPHTFYTRPSFVQVLDYIEKCKNSDLVSFDIETTKNLEVRCLGLSCDNTTAISIPFLYNPQEQLQTSSLLLEPVKSSSGSVVNYWTLDEEHEIVKALFDLFSSDVKLCAQNAGFDLSVLTSRFGFKFKNLWMDTMVAHHTLYCELPKALDFLVSIYTKIPYYSSYNIGSDTETWVYNCWDALGTRQVALRLERELIASGLDEFYFSDVNNSVLAYTCVQNRGVDIDMVEFRKQQEELKLRTEETLKNLRLYTGNENFNPDSPKQVSEFLYDKLNLPKVYKRSTGSVTSGKEALEQLERKYPAHNQFFKHLRSYGTDGALLSNFLGLELPFNKVFTSFNVAGTVTGRLASGQTFVHPEDSTNLQNIQRPPSRVRKCFVAPERFVWCKADLSQAEFRLVLWFGKIHRLIERYTVNPRWDVHRWFASTIFNCSEDKVQPHQRDLAKNGVYGGNYMMHYTTAAKTYKLELQTAKLVLDKYREAIPEIPLWWEEVRQTLSTARMLYNPLGQRRLFLGRFDDEMLRSALSWLPQSTVSRIINRAAVLAEHIFPQDECRVVLQVHDELDFLIRQDLVETYLPKIKNLLEYPVTFPGVDQPLVIPADVKVGPNWLECK